MAVAQEEWLASVRGRDRCQKAGNASDATRRTPSLPVLTERLAWIHCMSEIERFIIIIIIIYFYFFIIILLFIYLLLLFLNTLGSMDPES